MNLLRAFAVAAILTVSAQARDLRPSVGATYSRLDLSADGAYPIEAFRQQSIKVDLRVPISEDVDLELAGGPTELWIKSMSPTFQLQSVTVSPGGSIFGTYGVSGMQSRTALLRGYQFSASARYYFR